MKIRFELPFLAVLVALFSLNLGAEKAQFDANPLDISVEQVKAQDADLADDALKLDDEASDSWYGRWGWGGLYGRYWGGYGRYWGGYPYYGYGYGGFYPYSYYGYGLGYYGRYFW